MIPDPPDCGASRPSLTPSFIPASKETSRVVTSVESPEPHLGWHSRGYLPHWDHPGMMQSLNFRLGDSMPQAILDKWRQELGLNLRAPAPLSAATSLSFQKTGNKQEPAGKGAGAPREIELRRRTEDYLDAGHGACWLQRPEIARLMVETLLIFDTERYLLLAWCVMPNHVHVLIETKLNWPLDTVLHSWKSFTATKANQLLGRRGEFWQREYQDRYIRNAEHFENVARYIEGNPVKAGLVKVKTEWPWSSAKYRAA